MRTYRLGDICDTRYWISYEPRYWAWWRWHWSTGPTYSGTVRGFVLALPFAVIMGHERDMTKRTPLSYYKGWRIVYETSGPYHAWFRAYRFGVTMRASTRGTLARMIDLREAA
jgi:hypothetical protein